MIENDPLLQRMFKRRGLKKSSQLLLTKYFRWYNQVTGLTPSQAIEEADQEEEDSIRLRRRRIVKHLEDYEDYLSNKYAHTTVKNAMSAVRSFYHENYIELPPPQRKPAPPVVTLTTDDLPSRDDIRMALEISKPRNKAIILLNCSSGMGQSELINLTLGNFQDAITKYKKIGLKELIRIGETIEVGPLIWKLKRIKTGGEYTTYSTPESYESIINYLQLHPPHTLKRETPLFRKFKTDHDEPINLRRFGEFYERINTKLGFGKARDGRNHFRSHNLRKFCANQLKTGMGFDNAQFILGHRIRDSTRGAYLKPDLNVLYRLYYENMGRVTITREVEFHKYTDERVNELQAEIERRDERDQARDEEVKTLTDKNKRLVEDVEVLKAIARRQGQLPKK